VGIQYHQTVILSSCDTESSHGDNGVQSCCLEEVKLILVHGLRHHIIELLHEQLLREGLELGGIELGEDVGDGMAGHGGIQKGRKSDGTRR
jgi:hypothetical protein